MTDIKQLLDYEIYPALYERLEGALPEFNFKRSRKGYTSTTDHKITGEAGKAGKVYVYPNNISRLIDYTRGSISIWDYIQKRDGLSQQETLKKLSELSGVPLPELGPEQAQKYEKARKEATIWEDANSYFIYCLLNSEGVEVLKINTYLQGRGYSGEDVKTMELGYIPSQDQLYKYLHKTKGHSETEIKEAIRLNKDIGETHKLTVPYRDPVGRIKGIIVRSIAEGVEPKYLYNTGLERSKQLFNLRALQGEKDLVIVEGLLDALIAEAKGIENVVGLGGTSLNADQIQTALKYGAKKFTLCLDSDPAGQQATLRALELLHKATDTKVYIAKLPGSIKDPDQLLKEQGVESFKAVIASAVRDYDYKLDEILNRYSQKEGPEGGLSFKDQDKFLEEVIQTATQLQDPVDRDLFIGGLLRIVEPYGINKGTLEATVEKIRYRKDREAQGKELSSLLKEAGQLTEKGQADKAIDLLRSRTVELRLKDKEVEFSRLLVPTNEADIQVRQAGRPESLKSGYTVAKEELLIPAGALSIIAGPTSHGKTSLLINLALNIAEGYPHKRTYFFTYEEDGDSILMYALNTYMDLKLSTNNRKSIRSYFREGSTKYISPSVVENFKGNKEGFFIRLIDTHRLNVHYTDYTADTLIEAIRYLHKNTDVGAVIIDYMQLLRKGQGRYNSRQEELKQICLDLKDVAVDTGLPIILGAQFNREVVSQLQLHPTKIGEAGDIERVANLIVGLFNNKFEPLGTEGEKSEIVTKLKVSIGSPTLFIKILKNRGSVANIYDILDFDGNTGKIKNSLTDSF